MEMSVVMVNSGRSGAVASGRQDVDRASGVVDTPDATASDLAETETGARNLAFACALLNLLANFDDLRKTGCTWRMSLGNQAATRVDGNPPAKC